MHFTGHLTFMGLVTIQNMITDLHFTMQYEAQQY